MFIKIRTDSLGENFPVNSSLFSTRSMPGECGVFNSKVKSSYSGRQPRAVAMAYIIWGRNYVWPSCTNIWNITTDLGSTEKWEHDTFVIFPESELLHLT